ncbi:rhodanese family protein [Croceibacterium salegens]|uniref:rhodanese family protein n=1 Tax=Croceibacterium salegens TaxID=1737568 RepID=UPI0038B2C00F
MTPAEARRIVADGARLVDIRSPDEFARARVPGAENRPADALAPLGCKEPVVFMCRSGMRTSANAQKLAGCCDEGYLLVGGLDAWRKAGLPVEEDKSQPLEIMRQVQIVAGSLILVGVLLGFTVSPLAFGLCAFVGAGLTFAGVSGWCGMAHLLAVMPWNRRSAAA